MFGLVDSSEWHRWHSSSQTMDWDNNSESMEMIKMIKMIFSWESSPAITALRNCSRLDRDFQTWSQTPAGWSYSSGLDSCSLYEHLVSSWSSTLVSPSPSSRSWTPGPPSWCLRGSLWSTNLVINICCSSDQTLVTQMIKHLLHNWSNTCYITDWSLHKVYGQLT